MRAGHDTAVIRTVTWNLFHGRDHPPDPELLTWRSRLTRHPEWNATHQQVNRDLLEEFTVVLARAEWDVALLQECPPRFVALLARGAEAVAHSVPTSRNWLLPVTQRAARRNPDLIASWEGGSNATLVRGGRIAGRDSLLLRRLPERRVMVLTRLSSGLCVANLHASGARARAEEDVRRAARVALDFAGESPLIFGGDLNLRPAGSELFADLEAQGFSAPTDPDAIDHLLARGGDLFEPARAWPPERREVAAGDLAIRLSDHAPVEAVFEFPAP
jgi:endonuclease/exonuclease/phosphatase family metal-dependent hydrolase